jgi:hypothetical protein
MENKVEKYGYRLLQKVKKLNLQKKPEAASLREIQILNQLFLVYFKTYKARI